MNEDLAAPGKLKFLIRRARERVRAEQVDGELTFEAANLPALRQLIRAGIKAHYGVDRPASLLVGAPATPAGEAAPAASPSEPLRLVRPGQSIVMKVQPPPQYAGRIGARATVAAVSTDVYVTFEAGVRESFPSRRFREYFEVVPS